MIVRWWRTRRLERQMWAIVFPAAHQALAQRLAAVADLTPGMRRFLMTDELTQLRTTVAESARVLVRGRKHTRATLQALADRAPYVAWQAAENVAAGYEGRAPVDLWAPPRGAQVQ